MNKKQLLEMQRQAKIQTLLASFENCDHCVLDKFGFNSVKEAVDWVSKIGKPAVRVGQDLVNVWAVSNWPQKDCMHDQSVEAVGFLSEAAAREYIAAMTTLVKERGLFTMIDTLDDGPMHAAYSRRLANVIEEIANEPSAEEKSWTCVNRHVCLKTHCDDCSLYEPGVDEQDCPKSGECYKCDLLRSCEQASCETCNHPDDECVRCRLNETAPVNGNNQYVGFECHECYDCEYDGQCGGCDEHCMPKELEEGRNE